MSVRPLHYLGSPVLRERANEIGEVDEPLGQLVEDLLDTMKANDGIGLAANQIGATRRVAVVDVGDGAPVLLIDPKIVDRQGEVLGEEGCLSIPEIFGEVKRAETVVVETTTLENERVQVEADELKARAIQHEIDHLDGILFLDRLSPLKRQLLLRRWNKQRKGKRGHIQEEVPAATRE